MSTLEFYAERAAECRRNADASTLDNVRQRNLDAASAWEAMADRLVRTNAHREANEVARAAREA
ncbi:hypothetical protein [Sphingomonas sp. LHG3406-1]|uniref:hypothetical protein n=1 Tax=Sphingomonas sp. LHG3406-1 TaxID=2804617 RepID=UPI00260E9262|nr:hypothetical protein [Sphingomonas sp. LHG3406-1]